MKKTLLMGIILLALICTGCNKSEPVAVDSSSASITSSEVVVSSEPTSSKASSTVSSKEQPSSQVVSEVEATSSEASSKVSSEITSKPAVSSSASTSSKQTASSQPPKKDESKQLSSVVTSSTPKKEDNSDSPDFGELMDEATVDAIIAEGIEYANSKGMTWYEDFSVEESGFYNPAFSGDGVEIFKRDLLYHIDQLYDISINDLYYKEGNGIAYKIVKGEYKKGYWFGYVLY